MASDNEASCESDPNFAVICAFMEKFGATCGLAGIDFLELQDMLENTTEVRQELIDLHIKLLRKSRKSVSNERWERAIIKFCHTFCIQDAWEIERFGYKKARLSSKLRLLKELLEMQFDYNIRFKAEINKMSAEELRSQPLGKDKHGHAYWFQNDNNCQIRVYKEDPDEETWTLVAKDRDGLVSLISELGSGEAKITPEAAINEEDSNSLAEKPIIDTGQVDSSSDSKKSPLESENSNESKDSVKKEENNISPQEEIAEEESAKRLRDTDEDTTDAKIPKLEESEVSETIEEPLMLIKGEGSGQENEANPIEGDEIEEDLMFFYGQGDGLDCQMGNEEGTNKDETTSRESISTKEEVPKTLVQNPLKLSTIEDEKTDNKFFNDAKGPTKNSKWDVETIIAKGGENNNEKEDDALPVKKFFFGPGCPQISSATMGFGLKAQPNDVESRVDKKEAKTEEPADVQEDELQQDLDEVKQHSEAKKISGKVIESDIERTDLPEELNSEQQRIEEPTQNLGESLVTEKKLDEKRLDSESPPLEVDKEKENIKESAIVDEEPKNVVEGTKQENTKVEQQTKEINGVLTAEEPVECKNAVLELVEKEIISEESEEKNDKRNRLPEVTVALTRFRIEKENSLSPPQLEPEPECIKKDAYVLGDVEVPKDEAKRGRPRKNHVTGSTAAAPSPPAAEVPSRRTTRSSTNPDVAPTPAAEDRPKKKRGRKKTVKPDDDSPITIESSSSNDPNEIKEGGDQKQPPLSLATFSLDFTEETAAAVPKTRAGLRKRGRDESMDEDAAGKKPKMKGKRQPDMKLRKSIEEQKKKELVSSDEEREKRGEEGAEDGKETKVIKRKVKSKTSRLLSSLGINPEQLQIDSETPIGVRHSRRIAQIKIREEAERRKLEDELVTVEMKKKKKKSKKSEDKDYKVNAESEDKEEDSNDSKKKKKKKKKKHRPFDEKNPWRSSSDSSTTDNEQDDEEEEVAEETDEQLQFGSDHEFSPESDLEKDEEWTPLKRARTVRKESDVEEVTDDCPCQKCGKADHPEWILLCDSCDSGWHCSCLRPPLLVIPEGDWFCPPCQHSSLLKKLEEKLVEFDKVRAKKEIEDRRKERLAYVGISLNNVLPTKDTEKVKKRRRRPTRDDDDDDDDDEESSDEDDEDDSESESQSESEDDEPIYQLRQRRQAHSYRFNDFDDLINSAIQDEMEAVKGAGNLGRGKDIATIVNAEKEEEKRKEEIETPGGEKGEGEALVAVEEPEPLPPVVPVDDRDKEAKPLFFDGQKIDKKKLVGRKKHRKLNSLDISSEDEDSDTDFKGTSEDSDDDFDEDLGSVDSDDLDTGRNRRKNNDPVRRSTRARTSRYDADFIDDGDSDSDASYRRRKKKRAVWEDTESSDTDRSWGRRRRKPASNRSKKSANAAVSPATKKKKSKKKKKDEDSDAEVYRKKKPKIKFGLDDDDDGPVRRTRGKKINYIDALGSDSEEERGKRPPPRIESEEEYVAEEDEKGSEEESGDDKQLKEDDELNPIDQINRNVEMMDENDMEKMMEEEEYANKQLQMVALQLEKEKKRKEREAKRLEEAKKDKKEQFEFTPTMQEPLVGNVDNLVVNSENNDELSEPPGVSLPLFSELAAPPPEEHPKKRRPPKPKKSLEETVATLAAADNNIEIAAPPQPFSQAQPAPSVITRMLQAKPSSQPTFPVGSIRPKQFATMPDRDEFLRAYRPPPPQYQRSRPPYRLDPSPSGGGAVLAARPMGPIPPYHVPMPPYHFGQFEEAAPSQPLYQNSPYQEPFESGATPQDNTKNFEDEPGGEFGGLVSYFSSQREDDLES